ncbi:MAG TPA: phosphatase PAP2 family protein [Pseudonocardiaceae bacterium]|nr:phosphatase PAP2 family protein [Pseudonocardiaceae bacterium]
MRLPSVATATGAWGVAVVIGVLVAGQQHAGALDRALIRQVYAIVGDQGVLAELLLAPTDTGMIVTAASVLVVIALLRRRWDVAVVAAAAPAIAVGVTELVLKPAFGRRLYGLLSYPSGHAVAAMTVYTVAALALATDATRLWRRIIAVGWVLLTIAIMLGLVAMNCHYPTDTVGGVCVAIGVVLPCTLASDIVPRGQRAKVRIPLPRQIGEPYIPRMTSVSPSRTPRG